MPEVFISYASEDRLEAERLHRDLRREGFDAWIDSQDLLAGSQWAIEIRKAIRASQYFVLLLSQKCVTKRGFVHHEIREALAILRELPETAIFLIPTRLELCEVTHEDLSRLHWVNLFPDWDHGVATLMRSLCRRNLDPGPGVPKVQESNPTARLRGDTIHLPGRESQPLAIIASSLESLYEMCRHLATGDVKTFLGVIKDERGTMIPAGTLVEVVGRENYRELKVVRIKLLEGDLKGYTVWTVSHCLP